VIFPFEEPFYREQGVQAEFVGHPLAELPQSSITRAQFAAENGLNPAKTWIGLLPGSRPREIRDHLPTILRAAQKMHGTFEFLIPLAPTLNARQRDKVRQLVKTHGSGLTVRLVNDARAALHHARASIVASGTATVEAALAGNPFVVVYRVSALTYAIARRIVTVPHVAMANLIADKRVVPELIQSDFTAENILREIEHLLSDSPPRQSMMKELAQIRGLLTRGLPKTQPPHGTSEAGSPGEAGSAIDRVAAVALELLKIESL
jgi:lipid-A-disaccharide synthase